MKIVKTDLRSGSWFGYLESSGQSVSAFVPDRIIAAVRRWWDKNSTVPNPPRLEIAHGGKIWSTFTQARGYGSGPRVIYIACGTKRGDGRAAMRGHLFRVIVTPRQLRESAA